MVRVDREVIRQRLERMLFEVEQIESKLPVSCAVYEASVFEDRRYELEHRMYIALQTMLDVSTHIAVTGGARNLATNRDAVKALGTLGVVTPEVGERLQRASGLRNVLSHEYMNIDDARVYDAMKQTVHIPVEVAHHSGGNRTAFRSKTHSVPPQVAHRSVLKAHTFAPPERNRDRGLRGA